MKKCTKCSPQEQIHCFSLTSKISRNRPFLRHLHNLPYEDASRAAHFALINPLPQFLSSSTLAIERQPERKYKIPRVTARWSVIGIRPAYGPALPTLSEFLSFPPLPSSCNRQQQQQQEANSIDPSSASKTLPFSSLAPPPTYSLRRVIAIACTTPRGTAICLLLIVSTAFI